MQISWSHEKYIQNFVRKFNRCKGEDNIMMGLEEK
jgi:hypothetical protein